VFRHQPRTSHPWPDGREQEILPEACHVRAPSCHVEGRAGNKSRTRQVLFRKILAAVLVVAALATGVGAVPGLVRSAAYACASSGSDR
jgi:hypothetical protein